jgi:hypothetical protein
MVDAEQDLGWLCALGQSSEEEPWDVDDVEEEAKALVARSGTKKSAPDAKFAKALADKRRRLRIRAENSSAAVTCRPPRTLAHLRDATFNFHAGQYDHEMPPTKWPSKPEALINMAEFCESRPFHATFVTSGPDHPQTGRRPMNNLTVVVGICSQPRCKFHFDIRRRADEDDGAEWFLAGFHKHDALCAVLTTGGRNEDAATVKRKARRTAYSAQQLALAVVPSITTLKATVAPFEIAAVLTTIVRATPTLDLRERVCVEVLNLLRGYPDDNFKILGPYLAALRALGWKADYYQFDADRMDEVILERAKADHKQKMKDLPASKRTPFDASALKLPKAVQGRVYYAGWFAFPPTTKKMLAANKLIKVATTPSCSERAVP